jgi:hypothetical protein
MSLPKLILADLLAAIFAAALLASMLVATSWFVSAAK